MIAVIENAKQTLDHSSAHSSKYFTIRSRQSLIIASNCMLILGNVIIGFLMQISLTFGKTQVKSESTPHYWLSFAQLIT